jgi:hypothetical protein
VILSSDAVEWNQREKGDAKWQEFAGKHMCCIRANLKFQMRAQDIMLEAVVCICLPITNRSMTTPTLYWRESAEQG